MPLFMDIHDAPGATEEDLAKAHMADIAFQDKYGSTILTYWLNKDSGTVNCLVEAPSAEQANALHRAAHGMEAKKMIEVNKAVVEAFLGRVDQTAAAMDHATTQTGSSLRIILFTDMVGSPQMTQELGDAGAMEVLQVHDTIVRGALEQQGGREVKHTGDGIMAAFVSVAGSINCAIDIQRGISDNNKGESKHDLHVRIGLCAGEPVEKNQDLFGTSVQLAARICDHAAAEEILVAHTVQELSAGKGFKFGQPDEVLLKGFATPTKISSVIWQGS
ncbi:MAG: DUF4242 domain-containing protein [Candidatus Marinimicrobia bacterium]|nr:DUF4242 domain-containing protein [Candidatus Neomarinimicrobiota bacterium]